MQSKNQRIADSIIVDDSIRGKRERKYMNKKTPEVWNWQCKKVPKQRYDKLTSTEICKHLIHQYYFSLLPSVLWRLQGRTSGKQRRRYLHLVIAGASQSCTPGENAESRVTWLIVAMLKGVKSRITKNYLGTSLRGKDPAVENVRSAQPSSRNWCVSLHIRIRFMLPDYHPIIAIKFMA